MLATMDTVTIDAGRARPAEVRDPLRRSPGDRTAPSRRLHPAATRWRRQGGWCASSIRRKLIIERDGVQFHPDAIDAAARVAAQLLAEHPDGFTVAEFRDAIGATRKHVLPLLGELDARAMTRRRDDLRIAGPAFPRFVDARPIRTNNERPTEATTELRACPPTDG